jgi:peptidyl-tRNA hydrolase, PTH1 family
MKKVDYLVVGLGNPGSKYTNTRHNIGWMVAARLCERFKKPVMPMGPDYMVSSMKVHGKLILCALPTTYMNRSGDAVSSICKEYEISIEQVIVAVDEYNFDVGRVQVKVGGGDGGHNGIASIIEEMESNQYMKLRCGIGKGFEPGEMVDYVLSNFLLEEEENKEKMLEKAVDSIVHIIKAGKGRAISEINSGKIWAPKEEKKNTEEKNSGEEKKNTEEKNSGEEKKSDEVKKIDDAKKDAD